VPGAGAATTWFDRLQRHPLHSRRRCYRNLKRSPSDSLASFASCSFPRRGPGEVLSCTGTHLPSAFRVFRFSTVFVVSRLPLAIRPRNLVSSSCSFPQSLSSRVHSLTLLFCFSKSLVCPFRSFLLTNTALCALFYNSLSDSPESTSSLIWPLLTDHYHPPLNLVYSPSPLCILSEGIFSPNLIFHIY
jgi:hypothetical protein